MDDRIYYLLTKTENAMTNYIRQQFTSAGLDVTPAQLGILYLLKGKGGCTMTELSRDLNTDNSGITRAVDRLEKAGLVERKSSTGDRREYCVTITRAGIDETVHAREIIDAINHKISTAFTQAELDLFRKSLIKMNNLMRSDKTDV